MVTTRAHGSGRRRRGRVTEVSDGGRVPELQVVNDSPRYVLIVDGEELVGAKQNRIVNLTILVPPKTSLTIPVSCVEAGRWREVSREFTPAPHAYHSSGRRARSSRSRCRCAATARGRRTRARSGARSR